MADNTSIFDALDRAYRKREESEYAKANAPLVEEQSFPTVEEASRYAGAASEAEAGGKQRVSVEIKKAPDGTWAAKRVVKAADPVKPVIDPKAFAKEVALKIAEKNPNLTPEDFAAMRSWADTQGRVNAIRAEAPKRTEADRLSDLGFPQKAAASAGIPLVMGVSDALGGVPEAVARNVIVPWAQRGAKVVLGQDLEAGTPEQVRDVIETGRQISPAVSTGSETAGTLFGMAANPLMKVGGAFKALGPVASGAAGFAAVEAGSELSRQVLSGKDVDFGAVGRKGAQGAMMGGATGGVAARLEAIAARVGGRLGQAVKGALENVVLAATPQVTEQGVQADLPDAESLGVSTLIMAAFGGARGRGLSDAFKRELAKQGVPPEAVDRLAPRIEADLDAIINAPRPPVPDPVKAAAEVRGEFDARLAEVEGQRPAIPAIDPVAEARATAAEFDAKVAPESAAAGKPVSVAPVAPIAPPDATPPAATEAPAPKGKTLVGKDKRGQEVWEINGNYYTRSKRGPLGAAHPESVAEAKATRPARETVNPADDVPLGRNAAGDPVYERADGSRYRMRDDSPVAKPGGYPDFGGDLAPIESATPDVAPATPDVAAPPVETPAHRPGKQSERGAVPLSDSGETAMFAGGPESISTKAYEAWTATREGFRGAIKGLKDFFSSQKAPELLRLSPRAWRGVVAAESAPQIAKAAVKVWEAEVPNPSWSPKERVQFEAALTENNRLGAVDNRIADAEAKRTEAQALREQAATLNKPAAADALLKKATRLDREALVFDERAKRAEGKNEYLIGEGKPFASQAELAEFVSRPDVVEAAKRHQAWWSEMVEPSYKSAQSIEGTEPMPTRGRFFDSRASLVVPPEADATAGVAGTKAGQTENIKTRRSKFAHLAWGDSSRGYEVEANKYLKKALEDVVPKGGWRETIDALVSEGHGVRLTKPDQKPPAEIAGEPAMKFDIGQQGERIYLPKSLHETLTHIRQVGAATHIKGFTDLAKTATHQAMSMAKDNIFVMARAISRVMTLPSTGRPALEIAGNVALWPVMRVIDIAKLTTKALGYMRASPRERLEMARAGVSEREPMLKRDSKGRVETDAQGNPIDVDANLPGLKWLGPVSNAIDTAARESLVTTMRRLKASGVNIDTGPEAMSKYVGQLGRYGRAWYGSVQRFFTDSGANPFFESRRTSRGNALRTIAANPNLTPLDTGTALKLRGVVLSKLVGLMTTTAIANVLTTGDALGGPSTPIGAISLGKDKDGKRIFFDFWKLMGIRQVARATGIEQSLEGLRRGDDAGQVALSALTGAGREAAGFVSGPLPTAISIGATGSRPDQLVGGQMDASIPAAVDPITLARRRAVEGAKAALPLVGEGAELFAKWFGGENIKDILNAGTEVTPDMIDEFISLRNTVGVGVGQTDAQAKTLHDRSNKGFFFGTYIDAVKEDLRKASPDKVQSIVDKAWRDIDTREDLSAGDKKKAKSTIQYYARNRRLLMQGR